MPNSLAHLGVQTLLTRSAVRDVPLRWILLGAVLPDLPWIVNRALSPLLPWSSLDALRPYFIAQASWAGCLWISAALALLCARPARVFAVLAGNAGLHLLLDALQTKWGNGVHLFAPGSWQTWNAGWFWPESPVTLALTLLGLAVLGAALARTGRDPLRPITPPARRLAAAGLCLALYGLLPLAFTDAVVAADAHSLATLRDPAARPGRDVAFDRIWLERIGPGRGRLQRGDETLEVSGALPDRSGTVSARGRFRDAGHVELREVHVHAALARNLASYAGLAGVTGVWALQVLAGTRGRRPPA